jgi:hypothetical protein
MRGIDECSQQATGTPSHNGSTTHSKEGAKAPCDNNGYEAAPMHHYKHQWVVLDAMERQMTDDPEAGTVSSEHDLGALEERPCKSIGVRSCAAVSTSLS